MRSATNTLPEKITYKSTNKISQIKYEPINFDLYSEKQTKLIQINRIQYLIKRIQKLDLSFCKEKDEQQKHCSQSFPLFFRYDWIHLNIRKFLILSSSSLFNQVKSNLVEKLFGYNGRKKINEN